MIIYELENGDKVHKYEKTVVIPFNGRRRVLSTGPINGGYSEDLRFAFNQDANPGAGMESKLKAPSYEEHMRIVAGELGLEADYTTGISTAASMDNLAIKEIEYRDLKVTALVTAGIEVNGGRVGDPASIYEENGKFLQIDEGTINIILVTNVDLTKSGLTRALVTCTEAKTAAIQELMAGSNYSRGLATGSGTDGTIIIANSDSDFKINNTGKHCKMGELIGRVVKETVKEALYLQTGLDPDSQFSLLNRLKRFGVDEDYFWKIYLGEIGHEEPILRADFIHNIHLLDRNEELVIKSSLLAHLFDQLDWGLISIDQALKFSREIISSLSSKVHKKPLDSKLDLDGTINYIIDEFARSIIGKFIDLNRGE